MVKFDSFMNISSSPTKVALDINSDPKEIDIN